MVKKQQPWDNIPLAKNEPWRVKFEKKVNTLFKVKKNFGAKIWSIFGTCTVEYYFTKP